MSGNPAPNLKLKFGGRLVEQLGAQLYPSATATVAELISNAWDADARNVWVEMPFGDWAEGEIVVVDDGVGMDATEAQDAYLVVGRNRRENGKQRSPNGRLVHGRKGIGKLAAFGTASILEVKTRKAGGEEVAFRLDYDAIRKQNPDEPYQVAASEDLGPLANPRTGGALAHGTRVKLSGLRLKRRLDPQQFARSMARRFALNEHEMAIFINGERLLRFDMDLEYRFPPDRVPPGAAVDGKWAVEELADGKEVRWWIGFTQKPIKDDTQQGISVIVRGKLAQRPFMFDAGGGTTDQLGQEYLVGEVQADWIDDEVEGDSERDLIQSNRDQLQLEDEYLAPFLDWGRQRLRWALGARGALKRELQQLKLEQNKGLEKLLSGRPERERAALNRVAAAVSKLPEADEQEVVRVMGAVIGAREEETTRALAYDISLAGGDPDEFWALVRELAELDGRRSLSLIEARLETLAQLKEFEPAVALSSAIDLLTISPGILNPIWDVAEVIDLGEPQHGIRALRLTEKDPGPDTVVLLTSPSVTEDTLKEAANQTRAANLDSTILVLISGPMAVSNAVTWSEMVGRAAQLHRSWRTIVEARMSKSPPSP